MKIDLEAILRDEEQPYQYEERNEVVSVEGAVDAMRNVFSLALALASEKAEAVIYRGKAEVYKQSILDINNLVK